MVIALFWLHTTFILFNLEGGISHTYYLPNSMQSIFAEGQEGQYIETLSYNLHSV